MKITPRLLLASSAALAAFAAAPAAALTSFTENWDGTDFGSSPGFQILQSYSGWSNTTGLPNSGIEVQYNNVAGLAHSGANFVELDSNLNSTMTYDTGLDAGNYTLSFYYSDRPGVGAGSNGVEVLLNGLNIFTVPGGDGGSGTDWLLKTVNFTANAGDKLGFGAIGTSDSLGGYIDSLTLSAVPEPSTWGMMILGIGAAGAAMRRRQKVLLKYG